MLINQVVIGKGGETIDKIIEETGVKIDIDDEGNVSIYSSDQAAIDRAKEIIAGLVREAKVGEVYHAKVIGIEKFGAFVNLLIRQMPLFTFQKLHGHVQLTFLMFLKLVTKLMLKLSK